jgi:hypothetical protein
MFRETTCVLVIALTGALVTRAARGDEPEVVAPRLARTIVLPGVNKSRPTAGVRGRIDHLAYDPRTERLFVAALENGSLEVVDLERGERVASFADLAQPQGLAVSPETSCAVLACGGDGQLHIYDTQTLTEVRTVAAGGDADNVRYDPRSKLIYVSCRGGNGGAIGAFDPRTWERQRELTFATRPESFQLDPDSPRLVANLPGGLRAEQDGLVAVVNRESGQPLAEIRLIGLARNYPMALDAAHDRAFVAARRPATLAMLDLHRATVSAQAACGEDSDDLFYDAQTQRVYVICGGYRPDMAPTPTTTQSAAPASQTTSAPSELGSIDVFEVRPPSAGAGRGPLLERVAATPTAPHARTGLFVPQRRALYVAVPPQNGRDAEIREYRVGD